VAAEVEDVLGHREPGRRQPAVDDAVDDAGDLAPEEPQQDQRAERLHRLLDEGCDDDRKHAVGDVVGLEELGGLRVDHQGDAGGDEGAPGEAGSQCPGRLGFIAVQPQEAGH
jgi:hypothetical protein